MKIKILANRAGYLKDIEEVKAGWVNNLLLALNIDLDKLSNLDEQERVQFLIEKHEIDIVTYQDIAALKVEQNGEVVGEWAGPEFLLKIDKDTGEKYYEITIEAWTFMEEEIGMI